MAPQPDVQRPAHDPYSLVGRSWPPESESAYHAAEADADALSTTAKTQAESADDAAEKTDSGMQGKTADSVSSAYKHHAAQLQQQGQSYASISGWMLDAAGTVRKTKKQISDLVSAGTSEIREALDSEIRGTPVAPSSTELTTKYRDEIAQVAATLDRELDGIGHSLAGTPGASRTPSYVSVSTRPTPEHADPRATVVSYNHGDQPQVTPKALPEMPRATTSSSNESASAPTAPAVVTPHSVNPTLSNLISGSCSPSASSPGGTSSPHTPTSPSTQSTQSYQPTEQHQTPKSPGLPHIPSLPLDGLPVAAAESVATVVSAAAGHQLPTAAQGTITSSTPASTGFTPGVPGTSPTAPMTPGLAPIGGGGGLTPPAVTQPASPAPQAAPAAPPAASQQTPTRGPVADLNWIQRNYGLAPGVELPKSETPVVPALFIAELPDSEAHLHRVLGTLRQQFDGAGWTQPLAVAALRKGFESRTVYVTSDGLSIHPHGVLLPAGVTPLSEMPTAPDGSDLHGSIMVTDKLTALIPRGWDVENTLSTVPADEHHQTPEQFQELSEAGELLDCTVSRGRDDVTAGEAMSVFARAALGSGGCGELDVESARLRSARRVGVQPVDYLGVMARWYLADAAESMSQGNWGEAVYASGKYLGLVEPKSQAA